jgi:ribosomal protein S15P/S13E
MEITIPARFKVAIYVQDLGCGEEQLDSIIHQLEILKEHAKKNGWNIYHAYLDTQPTKKR